MIYIQEFINKIKKVILPPIPVDHYSSRKITLLGTISFAMFILAVLTLINNLVFGITHENYRLYFVIVSILFSMFLLKKNQINFSIYVLLYCTLVFLLSVIISQDGAHDRALFAYPGLLVAAALLLEKRGFIIFSTITIISVPVLGFLEIKGILVNELSFSTTFVYIINTVLIFSITALFLRILVNTISENLDKLRLNEEELRNQKELIAESEYKFKSLFEGSMDPILLLDDNARFIGCNDATVKILGANSKHEIIGKTPADLSPEFQPDGITSLKMSELLIQKTKSEGKELFEWTHFRFDGSELFVEVSLSQIKIDEQSIILVHWRDITKRKRDEIILRESEERFSKAFIVSPVPLAITEIETGLYLDINEEWCRLFGFKKEEAIGKRSVELGIYPDYKIREEAVSKIKKYGKLDRFPSQFLNKSGKIIDTFWSAEVISFGGRNVMLSLLIDYTEQKLYQEKLISSEEKFRSIIQGLTDLIFIFDRKGKIVFQSPSVYKTLGYSEQDTIGRSPFQFLHPDDVRPTEKELFKILNPTYDSKPFLQRVRHKDGYYIYLESIGINMVNNVYVKGVVVLSRDVTEKIKTDAALNESENRFSDLVNNIQDP
ncbi:MAG: PAS domain S-box protein, partial [Ignavibacteriales bacterium]